MELVQVVTFVLDNYSQRCWKWHFCRWLCFFLRLSHTHSFCFRMRLKCGLIIKDVSVWVRMRSDYAQQSDSCAPRPQSHVPFAPCWLCSQAGWTAKGDIAGHRLGGLNLHHGMPGRCSQPCTREESAYFLQSFSRMHWPKKNKKSMNTVKYSKKQSRKSTCTLGYYGPNFPSSVSFDSTFFRSSFTQQCCLNRT